jgi:hypothetical protein
MESPDRFPEVALNLNMGKANEWLCTLGCRTFIEAAHYVKNMPFGPNSKDSDPFILFIDKQGTCYTKHSVIAICARELGLDIHKHLCFYAITRFFYKGRVITESASRMLF